MSRETLLEVWDWLGGPPVWLGHVGRPSRRAGMVWGALTQGRDRLRVSPGRRDGSGGPPKRLGQVGRPFRTAGTG